MPTLSEEYVIVMFKKVYSGKSNYVMLSNENILKHLEYLTKIFPIEYSIEDIKDEIHVHVKLNGDRIVHKFALTWIRYMYEYPFNCYVYDMYKVIDKIPDADNLTLYNAIADSYDDHGRECHLIAQAYSKPIPIKDLKQRLKVLTRLDEIYSSRIAEVCLKACDGQFKNYSVYDKEYWMSEERYKKAEPIYIENYKRSIV